MPSITHQGMLQPFEYRPALAAELLAHTLGITMPAWQKARLESSDLTELVPTEYRADKVIVLSNDNASVLAVVLEVQLAKDDRKRYSWPVYLTTLRARLECPVVLLAISPRAGTAGWCADPIELGPGSVVTPQVLGPAQLPVVTDVRQARSSPELAVLSALAHGGAHPRGPQVLEALLESLRGLQEIDLDRAEIYHDVVYSALPSAARRYLEGLMSTKTYQFTSEFALRHLNRGRAEGKAQGKAEGKAEGEAAAVLAVLAARGIVVPGDVRERITGCTDLEQLETWVRHAATANSVADLFSA